MKIDRYDLVVIGAGPAGTTAASVAGRLGKSVLLIERDPLIGGAGINTGTIPSKTLRETALALSGWKSRRLFGVDLSLRREATASDFMRHEVTVTGEERQRLTRRLSDNKVCTLHGLARFVGPHRLRIESMDGTVTEVEGERIVIASGSSPSHPPEFPFEDDRVHDSNEILEIKRLPKRLVVIGAGVIGAEYASTFNALGTEVDLVDGRDVLLPFLDAEISRTLTDAMIANGVRFRWKERVTACDASRPGPLKLTLSSGTILECDDVLVCAGRTSNTDQLDCTAAGLVAGPRGLLTVDDRYRTAVTHIYAAGDVIGPPALAATSAEQARIAVCHMFGVTLKEDIATVLPTGIYTIPEASMVGETEESLQKQGIPYIVGRARYADNPRGRIIGDDVGFLKLLFARDDMRLLGAHVVGEQATEVIHIGLMAMLTNSGEAIFNRACFNYPTLGDLYKYATYDALMQVQGGVCDSAVVRILVDPVESAIEQQKG